MIGYFLYKLGVSRFLFPLSKTWRETLYRAKDPVTVCLYSQSEGNSGKHRETLGNTSSDLSPLTPTCDEEAEALRDAPPWRGAWAGKPTIRQRIMLWVNWTRYEINRK